MIDLKNMGTGRKLIKKIISRDKSDKKPWSPKQIRNQLSKQKNTKPKL